MKSQKPIRPKPITPYQRLLERFQLLTERVLYPEKAPMYFISKDKVGSSYYTMDAVYERAIAAKTLGYDVLLVPSDEGLKFEYRKQVRIPV